MKSLRILTLVGTLAASSLSLRADQFLINGSLEDLNSTFVNTAFNYMALGANSTAIAGWMVTSDTVSNLVWAKSPTDDGYNAAQGNFFVDLSGFGTSSPNGALSQTLSGLVVGESYQVSYNFFGAAGSVKVGGTTVTMGGVTADPHGSVAWKLAYGSFTASSSSMLFEVRNSAPNEAISFLDNLSVTGRANASNVPDGGNTLSLLGGGLLLLGSALHRLRR